MGIIKKTFIGVLAATMIYGGFQVYKKPKYYGRVLKETAKMTIDFVIDNSPKLKHDELYIDTHMHIYKPDYYKGGIEEIVDTAMEKVDVIMVTTHNKGNNLEVDYETFKQKVKENSKYKVKDYGKYIKIKTEYDELIAIKAQELINNEGMDILAIGCDETIDSYQGLKKTIEQIHKYNGIAIIAHSMTRVRKSIIPHGLANKEEIKKLETVCKDVDAIETFNSLNYLWMCRSNVLAGLFAEEHNLAGTAGSDTHGDLKMIGLSGIIVEAHMLDTNNLIEDLREIIQKKEFRVHKEYTDPISFIKTVIIHFKE